MLCPFGAFKRSYLHPHIEIIQQGHRASVIMPFRLYSSDKMSPASPR